MHDHGGTEIVHQASVVAFALLQRGLRCQAFTGLGNGLGRGEQGGEQERRFRASAGVGDGQAAQHPLSER
jgi:hypothetical protein